MNYERKILSGYSRSDQNLISIAQLSGHAQGITLAVATNIICSLVIVWIFLDDQPLSITGTWAACVLFFCSVRLALRSKGISAKNLKQRELIKKLTLINATCLSASWGIGTSFLYAKGESDQLVLPGMLAAGFLSTGSITYRQLPDAAQAWITAMTIPFILVLIYLGGAQNIALVVLLSLFAWILISNSKTPSNF